MFYLWATQSKMMWKDLQRLECRQYLFMILRLTLLMHRVMMRTGPDILRY